jgi:hypothetical protein
MYYLFGDYPNLGVTTAAGNEMSRQRREPYSSLLEFLCHTARIYQRSIQKSSSISEWVEPRGREGIKRVLRFPSGWNHEDEKESKEFFERIITDKSNRFCWNRFFCPPSLSGTATKSKKSCGFFDSGGTRGIYKMKIFFFLKKKKFPQLSNENISPPVPAVLRR